VKEMSATIEIAAPPQAVWAVLVDLSRYPDWNPVFREAAGEIATGKRIRLRSVHPANGRMMTVKPKIVSADPGTELRWASSLPGIISGEHSFRLTAADGGTRLVQSESFRGLLVPFSGKVLDRVQASFGSLNEAIKKRAEASHEENRETTREESHAESHAESHDESREANHDESREESQ
jgi:hypothetical protein